MNKNIIDVVKYRWVWITLSLFLVIPSLAVMVYSMIKYENHSPLRLGIDFTGGTLLQYGFEQDLQKEDIAKIREQLKTVGVENAIIQLQEDNTVSIRTKFLESQSPDSEAAKVNASLKQAFGEFVPLQVSAIGPTLGKELFQNALIALLLAFAGIVAYLSVRFSLDYAMFALVALFHDAIFVCGMFSLFGLLFGTEIDSLFITAILTVIGFSVHDTIVVFDRVRENAKFHARNNTFNEIVNKSVNQTLARSINTSVTTLVTLFALYFLGGVTTRDFVLAMILGIAIGTYSSIFNASVLLAWWREYTGKRPRAA